MKFRWSTARHLPRIFWAMATVAVVIWALVPGYTIGWDSNVYAGAMSSLRAGHDPYADGIALQQVYHAEKVHAPDEEVPYTYVYSPCTLVLLRALNHIPFRWVATGFWILYWLGLIVALWVGCQFISESERTTFALLTPAAVFFPGLLQNDVLFSGNIAYVLYGMLLPAAWIGWKRGQWWLFYITVAFVSLPKPHLLSMLVLPVLSARRQWLPAGVTAAFGVGGFLLARILWPNLFANYLRAVDLQFSYNHDFGSNPGPVFADALYRLGIADYHWVSPLAYFVVAFTVLLSLTLLRKYFLGHASSWKEWAPLLLLGAVLLNPRIMEYDVAAITIPATLVVWRFFGVCTATRSRRIVAMSVFGGLVNMFAPFAWRGFAPFVGEVVQSLVVVLVFAMGVWTLRHRLVASAAQAAEGEEAQALLRSQAYHLEI